ncbi:MAG: hypothetical protein HDT32_00205 [Clostridiales bacterium]|nr:hypothetical protein [Clostridiales bacterium]
MQQQGYEEDKQNKRAKSKRVNGLVIAIVFFTMDLILLGAFGKSGQVLTNFFVGLFGYAMYGYSFALTLLGVLMFMNVKSKQNMKIILLYVAIAVLVIIFSHILVSHNYANNGWGGYISQSYKSANTAGGAIASIFLFPFAWKKIYILSLVLDGILAVGLIAIAILLQVNIDINLQRFTRGKKSNKISRGQNVNVGMFDVDYQDETAPTLNNHTVDGKDMGDSLSAKGRRKNNLDNYVPIDRINVSQDQDFEIYSNTFPDEDAQLILDTEEIKKEVDRPELIYASEDIEVQDRSVDISRAQREILGIDGFEKMNVIDEGKQDKPIDERIKPQDNSFTPNYDTSRYAGFSTSERLRIMAENDRRSSQMGRDNFRVSENKPKETQSFGERINEIINKKSDYKTNSDIERKVDSIIEKKPENKFESFKSEPIVSEPIKSDDKAAEFDFKALKNGNKFEEKKEEKKDEEVISPKVEDRTETKEIESMDDFIANMNRQKKRDDLPEVRNYDATKSVEVKAEKAQPTDGYFQKTFEPKPITPKQPIMPKPPINKIEEKPAPKVEPEKKEEEKPKEKVKRSPYIPPSIDNLKDYIDKSDYQEDFTEKAKIIEDAYANFGIEVSVKNVVSGPAVTRFEFEVLSKIDVQRIRTKADNLRMYLAATSLRIEAPIPGKSLCGIEIPNAKRKTVGLKEFIENEEFKSKTDGLYFALGKDVDNNCHFEDLTDFPHGLIAGGTGSGKSVCLNTMLCSLVYKYSPEELRIVLVDPKRVEFGQYRGLPHLLTPKIYNTPKEAVVILRWLVEEMSRRYSLLETYGVNKLPTYNMLDEVVAEDKKLPYIIAILDEFGDIMVSEYAKEVETLVVTLAQKARACGIHLILATQRPSVNVITGLIKANLPTRIAFAVSSGVDSKTILDTVGAEELLGKGDMLVKTRRLSKQFDRLQNPFVDDFEIKNIMTDIIKHNSAYYDESIESRINEMSEPPKTEESSGPKDIKEFDFPDDLIPDVLRRIAGSDKVSISGLQRAFSIGFSRGGKIYDWLLNVGYTEKTADNKCVCRLSSEEVEEIIENARTGEGGSDE